MENDQKPESLKPKSLKPKSFVQWAITPPQSYAVYLVAFFLVAGLSFYAGTLRPKKPVGMGPPPIAAPAAPRN